MKTFTGVKRNMPTAVRDPAVRGPAVQGPTPGTNPSFARRAEIHQVLHGPRLQPKLTIGAPDDPFEREADRVADQVMRMPDAQVSHPVFADPVVSQPVGEQRIQRRCKKCEEEEKIRRQPLGGVPQITDDVAMGIHSLRGGGQPLPESTRAFFEPRFGADFSGVRVHTDVNAGDLAQRVEARAFTVGRNIVFGPRQYSPHGGEGRKLLAHELTHTIQQASSVTSRIAREPLPESADDAAWDRQYKCLKRRGHDPNKRPGTLTSSKNELNSLKVFNHECRQETGYTGPDIAVRVRDLIAPPRIGTTALANVSSVEVHCNEGITFHGLGESFTYRLTDCTLSEGLYEATVVHTTEGVSFHLGKGADVGTVFRFTYHLDQGQPDPKKLLGGQKRVLVRAHSSGTAVQDTLDQATGKVVQLDSVRASVNVDADHVLADESNKKLVLRKGRISASVSTGGINFYFNGGILLTPSVDWLPDPTIEISGFRWDFSTQTLQLTSRSALLVKLGKPGIKILEQLENTLTRNMPVRMFKKGYNPFTDPDFPRDLQRIAEAFTKTPKDPSSKAAKTSNAAVEATVELPSNIERADGSLKIIVPKGTVLELRANTTGPTPKSAGDLQVSSVTAKFSKGTLDLHVADIKVAIISIRGAELKPGGILSLSYSLITEELSNLGFLVLLRSLSHPSTALHSVEALNKMSPAEHKALRARIEAKLRKDVDPLIRQLILQHRGALPGVDLAKVLGIK